MSPPLFGRSCEHVLIKLVPGCQQNCLFRHRWHLRTLSEKTGSTGDNLRGPEQPHGIKLHQQGIDGTYAFRRDWCEPAVSLYFSTSRSPSQCITVLSIHVADVTCLPSPDSPANLVDGAAGLLVVGDAKNGEQRTFTSALSLNRVYATNTATESLSHFLCGNMCAVTGFVIAGSYVA
eukprot:1173652-Prorocentrum_minimum.AAC.5